MLLGQYFLLGVVVYFSWLYASRAGLVKEDTPGDVRKAVERRILGAQALYALGAALCILNTYVSITFIVLVQLNFAVAPPNSLAVAPIVMIRRTMAERKQPRIGSREPVWNVGNVKCRAVIGDW